MPVKTPLSALFAMSLPALALADHPSVSIQGALASPVVTLSQTVLEPAKNAASAEYQYLSFDSLGKSQLAAASEHGQDVHSTDNLSRLALNFAHGLSEHFTLGVSLPYVRREGMYSAIHHHEDEAPEDVHHGEEESHHEDTPGFVSLGNAEGLGDANLYGLYDLGTIGNGTMALLFGVKMPTGASNEKAPTGEALEIELQPGSGSWDPFVGVAWGKPLGEWTLNSNIAYKYATEGDDDTRLGDVFNYNLALSRPLFQHDHRAHRHSDDFNVSLVLEANGEWTGKTEIDNHKSEHSGGNLVYFSPGLTLTLHQWVLSASVGVPHADLNGLQGEPDLRFLLRLGRGL